MWDDVCFVIGSCWWRLGWLGSVVERQPQLRTWWRVHKTKSLQSTGPTLWRTELQRSSDGNEIRLRETMRSVSLEYSLYYPHEEINIPIMDPLQSSYEPLLVHIKMLVRYNQTRKHSDLLWSKCISLLFLIETLQVVRIMERLESRLFYMMYSIRSSKMPIRQA